LPDRSLIALQGPKAEAVLSGLFPEGDLENLSYMSLTNATFEGSELFISRLGYTGEDGFEISVETAQAPALWQALLASEYVEEIGLGARDTLRLEMGYPLYGHDIDAATSPIEADLGWVVAKNNESFIGSERVLREKAQGTNKKRVGIKLIDRGVAREGAEILDENNQIIGTMTSGGFSPSLKQAIGQGYINKSHSQAGTDVVVRVRGKDIKAKVELLPFVSPKTKSVNKK
jgi:aminomethyltransferase